MRMGGIQTGINERAIVGAVVEKRNQRKAGRFSLLWRCGNVLVGETSVVGGQRKG